MKLVSANWRIHRLLSRRIGMLVSKVRILSLIYQYIICFSKEWWNRRPSQPIHVTCQKNGSRFNWMKRLLRWKVREHLLMLDNQLTCDFLVALPQGVKIGTRGKWIGEVYFLKVSRFDKPVKDGRDKLTGYWEQICMYTSKTSIFHSEAGCIRLLGITWLKAPKPKTLPKAVSEENDIFPLVWAGKLFLQSDHLVFSTAGLVSKSTGNEPSPFLVAGADLV